MSQMEGLARLLRLNPSLSPSTIPSLNLEFIDFSGVGFAFSNRIENWSFGETSETSLNRGGI